MHALIASLNLEVQISIAEEITIYSELGKLITIAKDNEKFKKYFTPSLESLEIVKPFYEIVKYCAVKGL
jgi:hypothetical protein